MIINTIFPRNLTAPQNPAALENLAACFFQLISINATLEMSPQTQTAIYACTYALYVHTNRLITEPVYTHACPSL